MKSHRFEWLFGAALLLIFLSFSHWQSPGTKLSAAEIDTYLDSIDRLAPLPPEEKRELLRHFRAWAEADDGHPVYNLNLMRYYAQIRQLPGARVDAKTPAEANALYESRVVPLLLRLGITAPIGGTIQQVTNGATPSRNLLSYEPELDNWDRVLVVRYPSRRAFLKLIADPEYLKVMPYKLASLRVMLTPFNLEVLMPEPALVLGALCLTIFLAVGWWRSAGRARVLAA